MGVFKIEGKAEKIVNYDVAVIEIEFVAHANTSFEASSKVMNYCERFLEKLEEVGADTSIFTLKEDTISEEGYRDDDKIEAIRSVQVKIPFDMESINAIRTLVDEEKYDVRFELNYAISNLEKIREELMQEALIDSKIKAERLAGMLDMKIIGIETAETDSHGRDWWTEQESGKCFRLGNTISSEYEKSNTIKAKEGRITEVISVEWIIE